MRRFFSVIGFLALAIGLLEFEGGTLGLALNLDEDSIGAVVLGEVGHLSLIHI